MFGPHLILDGTRCDTQKLGDRILIEQLLSDYPAAIGMTKIGGPYMFEYQAPDPAYSGVSGIVVIAESHIAIHTFPALDYFTMDIFSCKNFDHERAIQYIKDALDVREMDRMLVQRGLSFRGPHHGANGATDELIAAAQARLAAGVVSNETATLVESPTRRDDLLTARTSGLAESAAVPAAGQMIWPQYGVTPDVGTYGAGVARTTPRRGTDAPTGPAGAPLAATESFQVNPTASISGLLDKLGGTGLGSRALSRALAEWEGWARDPGAILALALGTPVIAAGLRELLVYAVERRYVDVVVATGEDLYADLHESLGHEHFVDGDQVVITADDGAATAAFATELVTALAARHAGHPIATCDLLREIGEALPTTAPRKGLLQAAAVAGIPLYAPDLLAGPFGAALLAARAAGADLVVDGLADLTTLASTLRAQPRLGVIQAGAGLPAAFLAQALALPGAPAPAQANVALGAGAHAAGAVAVSTEPVVALPLLVSGLAQRIPGTRGLRARVERLHDRDEQRALA
ncbi:MAG TPA: adenosylmethionine decarboxylase [Ktedonobacterales bacterium]